jgi:hypothetical protein
MSTGIKMNKMVPMLAVVLFLFISSSFAVAILGSNSQSVNVSGTQFEDQYNSTQKQQSILTWSMSPIFMFLGFVFLLLVLKVGFNG